MQNKIHSYTSEQEFKVFNVDLKKQGKKKTTNKWKEKQKKANRKQTNAIGNESS